ncbi:MAG: hypothetical protein DF168_01510 [Candidatus Moanabacter tarae]|uniref:Putative regulatory protein FmdB zinc ribbon domain-containing protein n=1 Tax=Candidatus Moanibacter tarae TaxID=2200854 RepID=A0A2Z4AIS4_9BACT|nr:MAG: hypothetical protein DF168_01510 [Candidatus Moanabacter tarae]
MPTYEYECAACQSRFEVFQSITEDPLKKCPDCKSRRVKRLIGAGAGIIFKGSGFYETDYKRASQEGKKAEEKESRPGGKETTKEDKKETKKDSKGVTSKTKKANKND